MPTYPQTRRTIYQRKLRGKREAGAARLLSSFTRTKTIEENIRPPHSMVNVLMSRLARIDRAFSLNDCCGFSRKCTAHF
jgi:hypothetical protein